jgi:exosome complex RNA-binding protein Rrp42 (RNase PH superfamily)
MATAALTHPLLSAGERAFTAGGFADGVRADGRGRGDVRRVELGLGTLPQATGSAEVRLGRTHVVVGVQVRGESEKRARGAANAGDFFFFFPA